jgi:hypothetical protein
MANNEIRKARIEIEGFSPEKNCEVCSGIGISNNQ